MKILLTEKEAYDLTMKVLEDYKKSWEEYLLWEKKEYDWILKDDKEE